VCRPTALRTESANSAPKRFRQTTPNSQAFYANYVLQFTNTFKESEHWPFGNWPGKGPVETRSKTSNMERLRELAAQVATEQDHDRFMKLVEELNQLLDGDKQKRNEAADA
jgi:hypothetical protein